MTCPGQRPPNFTPLGMDWWVGGWCLAVVNQPDKFCGEQDMIQTFVSEGAQLLWLGNGTRSTLKILHQIMVGHHAKFWWLYM